MIRIYFFLLPNLMFLVNSDSGDSLRTWGIPLIISAMEAAPRQRKLAEHFGRGLSFSTPTNVVKNFFGVYVAIFMSSL